MCVCVRAHGSVFLYFRSARECLCVASATLLTSLSFFEFENAKDERDSQTESGS
jgi:hypothetical protein